MELARLHDRLGATMVYVTHDQVEALSLGDRLAVMSPGGIQQVGPPMEVYQRPANLFVAGFLGLPPMNLLAAELVDGGGAIDFHDSRGGSQRLSTSPSWRACLRARGAGPVMLGVRPEHISLSTWVDGRVGIPGTVEGSESMGTETLVHVLVSGQRVIARLPAQQRFSRGDRVELRFDVEQAHFFDPKSGSILK
jgi:multiple sugar transport system ATP-binding protein